MAYPELPPPPEPQGAYLPAIVHAGVVYTAGMTPREDGRLVAIGRVGEQVSIETARQAAGLSALRALSAASAAVGGLDQVIRLLRLTVYVACGPDFTEHSRVADGASEALEQVLGAPGRTVRTACGVSSLPGGSCVEVELVAVCKTLATHREGTTPLPRT
ncbi:MAG: Endoribonuclease [Marmoricola sp.]|nr:Endoribonuclease [Marmoricola sp.]